MDEDIIMVFQILTQADNIYMLLAPDDKLEIGIMIKTQQEVQAQ